jgi:hypothetical protein
MYYLYICCAKKSNFKLWVSEGKKKTMSLGQVKETQWLQCTGCNLNKFWIFYCFCSPWVSNFGHVTTKVNVHGQNSSAEVSFLVIIFQSSRFKLCYIAYRPRKFRCFLKMYLVSSNVLYFMRTFKQYLQIVDDNVHTIV